MAGFNFKMQRERKTDKNYKKQKIEKRQRKTEI